MSAAEGTTRAGPVDTGALDEAVRAVARHATAWAQSSAGFRRGLLDQMLRDVMTGADPWLADACRAKGIDPDGPEAGEELLSGVLTLARVVRLLRDSLDDIERTGRPQYPGPVRTAPGDRLRVGVFPLSPYDRLVYPQTRADVWMSPGVSRRQVDEEQAWAHRDPQSAGGTCLVLGAGNVASLGPRDALYKLLVEGKTVLLKASPVNEYLVPHWERALRVLVERGFLRIVRGGEDVGSYLIGRPEVREVHVTGSDRTYDAIVFGTGPEGARRKAAGEPVLDKPVTCELGNVSPVVVVPGRWSRDELLYQARHVATMLVNNAGFNCLTPRVLVTHAGWDQRVAFLEALAQTLRTLPPRRPYYPGADGTRSAFLEHHPESWELGDGGAGTARWTLVPGVNPGRTDDICFTTEAFCGLMAETAVAARSPTAFVDGAVELCNEVLWGTLSATVLAQPAAWRHPELGAAVDRAIADLRYGSIGVNVWHAHAFALGSTTWGAYPGHEISDIQSGSGVVGNTFMLRQPQKSVVWAPFRARPTPAWFATNPSLLPVVRRMMAFEAEPSPSRLAALLGTALRG